MKTIALIGNPNCGKTTFFNKVTGAGEYVGNRTGVTVKETLRKIKGRDIILCDLPGIYSLSGYSGDEKTALNFITRKNPQGIINIVDGTNLGRGLYLTIQLLKLNLPVILAINMKDECEKAKISVDVKGLSKELGIDIVFISGKTGEGTDKLISLLENIKRAEIVYFNNMLTKLRGYEEKSTLKSNEIIRANSIYNYIDELCDKYVKSEKNTIIITGILDKIFLNKYLAYPLFFLVMASVMFLTFGKFGQKMRDLFLFAARALIFNPVEFVSSYTGEFLSSLIKNGLLPGLESVVAYLPYLLILFMLIHFLEDCGYTSRVAYIMDSFMRKLGLSGKCVIPLLLGFGCTTPAILSARIIEDKNARKRTAFLAPFISCSAKIPVYSMLASVFFYDKYMWCIIFAYFLSVGSVVVVALITKGKEKEEGFVLELPKLRIPSFFNVFKMTKIRIKEFLIRAGTVIAGVSVLIWFLSSYDFSLSFAATDKSILCVISKSISFIFKPLGFSDYRIVSSLIAGIAAKETIASSLAITAGGIENIHLLFDLPGAASFICFVVLYMPCISSYVTLMKETESKKLVALSLVSHFLISYGVSFVVYHIL